VEKIERAESKSAKVKQAGIFAGRLKRAMRRANKPT